MADANENFDDQEAIDDIDLELDDDEIDEWANANEDEEEQTASIFDRIRKCCKWFWIVFICRLAQEIVEEDVQEEEEVQTKERAVNLDLPPEKVKSFDIQELSPRHGDESDDTEMWVSDGEIDPGLYDERSDSEDSTGQLRDILSQTGEKTWLESKITGGFLGGYSAGFMESIKKIRETNTERGEIDCLVLDQKAIDRKFEELATTRTQAIASLQAQIRRIYTRGCTCIMLHPRFVTGNIDVYGKRTGLVRAGQLVTVRKIKVLKSGKTYNTEMLICRAEVMFSDDLGVKAYRKDAGKKKSNRVESDSDIESSAGEPEEEEKGEEEDEKNEKKEEEVEKPKKGSDKAPQARGWIDICDLAQGHLYAVRSDEFKLDEKMQRMTNSYMPHFHPYSFAEKKEWKEKASTYRNGLMRGDTVSVKRLHEWRIGTIMSITPRSSFIIKVVTRSGWNETTEFDRQSRKFRLHIESLPAGYITEVCINSFFELQKEDGDIGGRDVDAERLTKLILSDRKISILLHSKTVRYKHYKEKINRPLAVRGGPGGKFLERGYLNREIESRMLNGYSLEISKYAMLRFINAFPTPKLDVNDNRRNKKLVTPISWSQLEYLVKLYIERDSSIFARKKLHQSRKYGKAAQKKNRMEPLLKVKLGRVKTEKANNPLWRGVQGLIEKADKNFRRALVERAQQKRDTVSQEHHPDKLIFDISGSVHWANGNVQEMEFSRRAKVRGLKAATCEFSYNEALEVAMTEAERQEKQNAGETDTASSAAANLTIKEEKGQTLPRKPFQRHKVEYKHSWYERTNLDQTLKKVETKFPRENALILKVGHLEDSTEWPTRRNDDKDPWSASFEITEDGNGGIDKYPMLTLEAGVRYIGKFVKNAKQKRYKRIATGILNLSTFRGRQPGVNYKESLRLTDSYGQEVATVDIELQFTLRVKETGNHHTAKATNWVNSVVKSEHLIEANSWSHFELVSLLPWNRMTEPRPTLPPQILLSDVDAVDSHLDPTKAWLNEIRAHKFHEQERILWHYSAFGEHHSARGMHLIATNLHIIVVNGSHAQPSLMNTDEKNTDEKGSKISAGGSEKKYPIPMLYKQMFKQRSGLRTSSKASLTRDDSRIHRTYEMSKTNKTDSKTEINKSDSKTEGDRESQTTFTTNKSNKSSRRRRKKRWKGEVNVIPISQIDSPAIFKFKETIPLSAFAAHGFLDPLPKLERGTKPKKINGSLWILKIPGDSSSRMQFKMKKINTMLEKDKKKYRRKKNVTIPILPFQTSSWKTLSWFRGPSGERCATFVQRFLRQSRALISGLDIRINIVEALISAKTISEHSSISAPDIYMILELPENSTKKSPIYSRATNCKMGRSGRKVDYYTKAPSKEKSTRKIRKSEMKLKEQLDKKKTRMTYDDDEDDADVDDEGDVGSDSYDADEGNRKRKKREWTQERREHQGDLLLKWQAIRRQRWTVFDRMRYKLQLINKQILSLNNQEKERQTLEKELKGFQQARDYDKAIIIAESLEKINKDKWEDTIKKFGKFQKKIMTRMMIAGYSWDFQVKTKSTEIDSKSRDADAAFKIALSENDFKDEMKREEKRKDEIIGEFRQRELFPLDRTRDIFLLNTKDVRRVQNILVEYKRGTGNLFYGLNATEKWYGAAKVDIPGFGDGGGVEKIIHEKKYRAMDQKHKMHTKLHRYAINKTFKFRLSPGISFDDELVVRLYTNTNISLGVLRLPVRSLMLSSGLDCGPGGRGEGLGARMPQRSSGGKSLWTAQINRNGAFFNFTAEITPTSEGERAKDDEEYGEADSGWEEGRRRDFTGEWVSLKVDAEQQKKALKSMGTSLFFRSLVDPNTTEARRFEITVENDAISIVVLSQFGHSWSSKFNSKDPKPKTIYLYNGSVAYKKVWWGTAGEGLRARLFSLAAERGFRGAKITNFLRRGGHKSEGKLILHIATKYQHGGESMDQYMLSHDSRSMFRFFRMRKKASKSDYNGIAQINFRGFTSTNHRHHHHHHSDDFVEFYGFYKKVTTEAKQEGSIAKSMGDQIRTLRISITKLSKTIKRKGKPIVVYSYIKDDDGERFEVPVKHWGQIVELENIHEHSLQIEFWDKVRRNLHGVAHITLQWADDDSQIVASRKAVNILAPKSSTVIGQVYVHATYAPNQTLAYLSRYDSNNIPREPLRVFEWESHAKAATNAGSGYPNKPANKVASSFFHALERQGEFRRGISARKDHFKLRKEAAILAYKEKRRAEQRNKN